MIAAYSVLGAWEPFQNSTHNGTYWAARRTRPGTWGGYQVMNTRTGSPRRFGSEATAQLACDRANGIGVGSKPVL